MKAVLGAGVCCCCWDHDHEVVFGQLGVCLFFFGRMISSLQTITIKGSFYFESHGPDTAGPLVAAGAIYRLCISLDKRWWW